MANLILFDGDVRTHLLPLTFSRPVAALRVGTLTIAEKWERQLGLPASYLTQDYLSELFPLHYGDHNLLINGSVLPTPEILAQVLDLDLGEAYLQGSTLIAACLDRAAVRALVEDRDFGELSAFDLGEQELLRIRRPADLFALNGTALGEDFALLTAGRQSQPLPASNVLIGPPERLFIEEGVSVEACTINVTGGAVYLARGATLMEGCLVRGPLSVGEGSTLKMGAKVYANTTVGPACKVGGEVNNVVFLGNSNKGHDGFLGNAVVGEWCNLGADTNASNLKNDYGDVRVWNYAEERFAPSGRQFHGLIMGDHSKAGINTMFNTGTVVGFSSNVFGEGFPRPFIPSFAWGGAGGFQTYRVDKALATARRVLARRGRELSAAEEAMFRAILAETAPRRSWEKG